MRIDEVVKQFDDDKLRIKYIDATDEEISKLSEILEEYSILSPHDGDTYLKHMRKYRENFGFLGNSGHILGPTACSWTPQSIGDKPVMDITEVLEAGKFRDEDAINAEEFDNILS